MVHKEMNVLFVGDMSRSARSRMWHDCMKQQVANTKALCYEILDHKNEKIRDLDFLTKVRWKLRVPKDDAHINRQIKENVSLMRPDVLWILKAPTVWPSTLKYVKSKLPDCKIIFYSEDDMYAKHNRTIFFDHSIKYFDLIFTTKSYNCNADELPAMGARKVAFVDKAFHKERHKPFPKEDGVHLAAPVLFIGTFEKQRANSMLHLAKNDIKIRIWGNNWPASWKNKHPNLVVEGKGLDGEDYSKAICSAQINLAFLRKANRDQQTDRSMEIPACESFMLNERTDEHLRLFEEDKEAAFFSNDQELLEKVTYYLKHPELCHAIGTAGRKRCLRDGYDMHSRMNKMLGLVAAL